MIINLRGTHGSGKSTIVRQLIKHLGATPESLDSKGRPNNYVGHLKNNVLLYIIGSYETACGGCDAIQPYAEIWPRVEKFAGLGHVVFEGALVSSSYGNVGRASEIYGDQFIFAFLNTPLETCITRIKQRREKRGDFRPLNPKNTEYKYQCIQKSINKIQNEYKRRVVILDYATPLQQILFLLNNAHS
jgi:hypothetical protein